MITEIKKKEQENVNNKAIQFLIANKVRNTNVRNKNIFKFCDDQLYLNEVQGAAGGKDSEGD